MRGLEKKAEEYVNKNYCKILFLTASIGSLDTYSQVQCDISDIRPAEKFNLAGGELTYFISNHPKDPDTVGVIYDYVSWGNDTEYGNYLFQFADPSNPLPLEQRTLKLTGSYDPVFTPDGELIVEPLDFYPTKLFYKDGKLISTDSPTPIHSELDFTGAYQSLGLLESSDTHRVYRMLVENLAPDDASASQLFVRDYVFSKASDELIFESKTNFVELCNNAFTLKTPRLSQTGKYFGAYNVVTRKTEVYAIKDGGLTCEKIPGIDLGVHTGKLSFDANDDRIAFHVNYVDGADISIKEYPWSSSIDLIERRDIYVVELMKDEAGNVVGQKSTTRLTQHTSYGEGGWYPSFSGENYISYVTKFFSPEAGRILQGLVQVDLSKQRVGSSAYLYSTNPLDEAEARKTHATYLIAAMALRTCRSKGDLSPWFGRRFEEALSDVALLTPEACREVVESEWSNIEQVLNDEKLNTYVGSRLDNNMLHSITKEEALNSCPSTLPTTDLVNGENNDGIDPYQYGGGANQNISQRCGLCHGGGGINGPRIPFEQPESLSLIDLNASITLLEYQTLENIFPFPGVSGDPEEWERRWNTEGFNSMPPGGTSNVERDSLRCYFYDLRRKAFPKFNAMDMPAPCPLYLEGTEASLFESNDVIALLDNATTNSTILVDVDESELVDDTLIATVSITHEFVGDLELDLTSPSGTTINLLKRSNNAQTFILESFLDLEAFVGEPLGGEWTLTIRDTADKDIGKLNSWSLRRIAPP